MFLVNYMTKIRLIKLYFIVVHAKLLQKQLFSVPCAHFFFYLRLLAPLARFLYPGLKCQMGVFVYGRTRGKRMLLLGLRMVVRNVQVLFVILIML